MSHPARTLRSLALAVVTFAALPASAQWINPCQPPRPPTPPLSVVVAAPPTEACPTGDCVAHDLATQDECAMFERPATGDSRWASGLSRAVDRALFQERGSVGWTVTAYRIRWSNGAWSEWYVAGVNDLDHKVNPGPNTMRRMWSYFADHEHQALACRPRM